MNGRGHSFFPIVVLTLLAGVSVWLDRVTQQEPTAKTDKTRHETDFTASNLTLRRFDLTGKIQYVLIADSMAHFADDESTELVHPRLNYTNRPVPVWIESNLAKVSKDGEVVVLTDKVFLRRAAHDDKPESTLRTEAMTIWPDDEKMRADQPVTLTQGKTVITAERMDSDNIVGEVHLQGHVRGTLYRNTPTPKP
ncbi:MAG TPA: LPS export ABC transporter periplasmic protein LptC [Zoogloea sp.]|uniref:LPS export ABC transporter periplasmic protein LptC n=1 Tax=Zoogloea sp. TaxID=49181 RepID=UPI002C787835|nr:LPS export ABC transporter periplasmic protein LptC [Zoogloea sp.]HOB45657.1 LPS export ABC transporter periplasmic protein LptC [Zoogloea sp.]HQA09634.1 LPS export ABC transporter periplasmic protein LptC [Zoogloea sp.]HQE38289.1 LPS export ABC transporter periplasmic protein LptC [Zoogloea sp.]